MSTQTKQATGPSSLLVSSADDNLNKQSGPRISVLIWIQTI